MSDPAPAPAPAPIIPAPAPAPNGAWFDTFPDEVKGYVANKGLDKLDQPAAFQKVVDFHRNAEKMLGAPANEMVRIPKPDAPTADWDAYYTKLGRPESVDKYELPVTDTNKERAAAFAQAAFKAGTPKEKAQSLWKEMNDYETKIGTDQQSRAKADLTNETAELKKSWGKDFDAKKIVAMRAFEAYAKANGQSVDEARANFEASINQPGFSKVWNWALFFGQKMGEDTFIPGGIQPNALYTRESALARVAELKADTAWVAKYNARDTEAVTHMRALLKIAYPEGEKR